MTRALLTVFLACVSCHAPRARFATVDPNAPEPPRRPPGVIVDRSTRLPPVASRATATSSLAVLSAPRRLAEVRDLVDRFFRAIVAETPAELDELLADQAWLEATSGRLPARNAFRSRFAQLDYTALRGALLYRDSDLEIYRSDEARSLSTMRPVPGDLRSDELFVLVRVAVSHAGKLRLFSDEVTLTLRSDASGLRILRVAENTPVP